MKNFNLQVDGRTFEIEFIFINREGYIYKVYEHIEKANWWSCNRKYLFKDIGLVGENVKDTIINAIKEHLSDEEIYNDFLKQINNL